MDGGLSDAAGASKTAAVWKETGSRLPRQTTSANSKCTLATSLVSRFCSCDWTVNLSRCWIAVHINRRVFQTEDSADAASCARCMEHVSTWDRFNASQAPILLWYPLLCARLEARFRCVLPTARPREDMGQARQLKRGFLARVVERHFAKLRRWGPRSKDRRSDLQVVRYFGGSSMSGRPAATAEKRSALAKMGLDKDLYKLISIIIALALLAAPPMLVGQFAIARANMAFFAPSGALILIASILRGGAIHRRD